MFQKNALQFQKDYKPAPYQAKHEIPRAFKGKAMVQEPRHLFAINILQGCFHRCKFSIDLYRLPCTLLHLLSKLCYQ